MQTIMKVLGHQSPGMSDEPTPTFPTSQCSPTTKLAGTTVHRTVTGHRRPDPLGPRGRNATNALRTAIASLLTELGEPCDDLPT